MMHDIHFHQGYTQYPLDFSAEQLSGIDFSAGKNPAQPSFYRFNINLDKVADTFIDCSNYGKGVIIVNGKTLGVIGTKDPCTVCIVLRTFFMKERMKFLCLKQKLWILKA